MTRLTRAGEQEKLFDMPSNLPNGFLYRPDFISAEEEEILLAYVEHLPLSPARFGEYTAKRRSLNFGWSFDERWNRFIPGAPLPPFLARLQRRIAKWLAIDEAQVAEALINEYEPGAGIGWHRDREHFAHVVGISLSSWCRMRLRPLSAIGHKNAVVSLELEPRSGYLMQGDSRWRWQHSVAPVEALRYSITFRTLPFSPSASSSYAYRAS